MFRVNRPTVGRSTPQRLRQLLLCSAALCLLPGIPLRAQANYELAVTAKQAQIKWTEADLQAAQRELAVLDQFLGGYDGKASQLASARQQLAGADAQLATIEQNNLVKLTLRMGLETYNTVSDTINLGKSAANALITTGVNSAIGAVAFDKLTSSLTSEGQAALGMDAASLSTPRTVKIAAVTASARAAYPGLDRVQQMLSLSLEAVKAAAYHEDGTELGDTGAILRKNLMVRDEIANALTTLDALGTDTAAAKDEAESHRPAVEAEVTRLTDELNTLNAELETLKVQWSEEEAAARAAANAAAIVPPVDLPPPSVSVVREDNESDSDYAARVEAAIRAAAQAQWDAESPPILEAITTTKNQINEALATIASLQTTSINDPRLVAFISTYGGKDRVAPETTSTYRESIASYSELDAWIASITPASQALSGLITQVEALTDAYTTLHNQQNELTSLQQVLAACNIANPPGYSTAVTDPGMGQESVEALAVTLEQLQAQLPAALANAQAQLLQLSAATDAWAAGNPTVSADLDNNLAIAETALAELVSKAGAWEAALAAADGLVVGAAVGTAESRYGYYSGNTFIPIIRHEFSESVYHTSLLAALATPGSSGLTAARSLKARYDNLVATSLSLKDAFDSALQRFKAAYARLQDYSRGTMDFGVYGDWSLASAYSSEGHAVDTSGITNQKDRFVSIFNTVSNGGGITVTSLSGGPPVEGQPVIWWQGIHLLHQLPDPGMDDPTAYLPHRLLVLKGTVIEDGPTWFSLSAEAFSANVAAAGLELSAIYDEAISLNNASYFSSMSAISSDLGQLQTTYYDTHPLPVIEESPAGSVHPIPPGTTCSTTLSVTASGDPLTYQWYVTRASDESEGWDEIAGATAATYTTPALSGTRGFRVVVSNANGSATSDTAWVEVYVLYPKPVFTSAATASAQTGVAFKWTFTCDSICTINTPLGAELPAGLTFDDLTATLEGTPTVAGVYDIFVYASNQTSLSTQNFRLTITEGTLAPFDAWIQQCTTADQRLVAAYTRADGTPAGDGLSNLLKFAFNVIGNDADQVPGLDIPYPKTVSPTGSAGLPSVSTDGSGRLTVLYMRRKAASQPGITYAVEFSSTLAADSWAVNASATEVATSIDDTWERVLVTDSAAMSPARFVRLRVERP